MQPKPGPTGIDWSQWVTPALVLVGLGAVVAVLRPWVASQVIRLLKLAPESLERMLLDALSTPSGRVQLRALLEDINADDERRLAQADEDHRVLAELGLVVATHTEVVRQHTGQIEEMSRIVDSVDRMGGSIEKMANQLSTVTNELVRFDEWRRTEIERRQEQRALHPNRRAEDHR